MKKNSVFISLGLILLVSVFVVALELTREDKTLDIDSQDKTTLEDLKADNLSYSDFLDFNKAVRQISNADESSSFNMNIKIQIQPFNIVCILEDNVTLECLSEIRVNKTGEEINSELDLLTNEQASLVARVNRERKAEIVREPIRDGFITTR